MKGPPVTWAEWADCWHQTIQDFLGELAESPPPADSPLGRLRKSLIAAGEEYEKERLAMATQDTERLELPKS